jgi:hypothetical protein
MAHIKSPGAKFIGERANRQMRTGFQPGKKPRLLARKNTGALTPHRLGRSTARSAQPL